MSEMLVNSKSLFLGLVKAFRCNLVLDVGSRDGFQALAFRDVLPDADIVAFEANPFNFEAMTCSEHLRTRRIEVAPLAISNADGLVRFHVTDVDYDRPDAADNNRGTSSTFAHADLRILQTLEIPSSRVDSYVDAHYPARDTIAVWIDVEGGECQALEGMENVRDRVKVVHVETTWTPMREGQVCFPEISKLMGGWGFRMVGTNIRGGEGWGDVVFVSRAEYARRRWAVTLALLKARLAYVVRADAVAVQLKRRYPRLYAWCRRMFLAGL